MPKFKFRHPKYTKGKQREVSYGENVTIMDGECSCERSDTRIFLLARGYVEVFEKQPEQPSTPIEGEKKTSPKTPPKRTRKPKVEKGSKGSK